VTLHADTGGEGHRDPVVVVVIGHGDEVLLVVDEPRRLAMATALITSGRSMQIARTRSVAISPSRVGRWSGVTPDMTRA